MSFCFFQWRSQWQILFFVVFFNWGPLRHKYCFLFSQKYQNGHRVYALRILSFYGIMDGLENKLIGLRPPNGHLKRIYVIILIGWRFMVRWLWQWMNDVAALCWRSLGYPRSLDTTLLRKECLCPSSQHNVAKAYAWKHMKCHYKKVI